MAASVQDRNFIFHTFGELEFLEKITEIVRILSTQTVGQVFKYLLRYSDAFEQDRFLFDKIIDYEASFVEAEK